MSQPTEQRFLREARASTDQISDEMVIARVLAGDLSSFEILMRRYNQRVYRIARSILRHDHDAEDVLQESFVRAFEHLGEFEGRASFATWLTKIAIYEASARRRRRDRLTLVDPQRKDRMPFKEHDDRLHADHAMASRELHDSLIGAVDSLPPDLRTVFVLRAVEGLDTAETARCLDISSASVKVRLHRARQELQERVSQEFGEHLPQLHRFAGARCDRAVSTVLRQLSNGYMWNRSKWVGRDDLRMFR